MSRDPIPKIRKTDGQLEAFDESKLQRSLRRSGAHSEVIEQVLERVRPRIKSGMSTRAIYRMAWRLLGSRSHVVAARYSLRNALGEFGPQGYVFESYVGLMFEALGWATRTGVRRSGRFVEHEIDVEARRGGELVLSECKYRIRKEGKVDVRVALYIYGRATDLEALSPPNRRFLLATNARFTSDARAFGEGMGLNMLGWDHPKDRGLETWISQLRMEPVTVLASLRKRHHHKLIGLGVLTCRQLAGKPKHIDSLGLDSAHRKQLERELDELGVARDLPDDLPDLFGPAG